MIQSVIRRIGAVAAVVLLACGGGDKSPNRLPTGDHTSRPGMGDSTERPTGQAYSLPVGIQFEGGIAGEDESCWDVPAVGDGYNVTVCFALRNTTEETITVRLPPGLIFVSKSLDYQNGIILQETVIEVPRGEVVVVRLGTSCLNLSRSVPDPGAGYELGPITQDEGLLEIASLIAGKVLDPMDRSIVQEAIWDVTDGDGLTADNRTALEEL